MCLAVLSGPGGSLASRPPLSGCEAPPLVLGNRGDHSVSLVAGVGGGGGIVGPPLKGHGNEADFPRFLHKSVLAYRSLTLHFQPFRFCRGDIRNRKTTRRLSHSPGRGVAFRLRISPRIRSQNRNGSKGSVRDS
jgi:hypothetical protein